MKSTKSNAKTMKYVVTGPVPQKGQRASSGGIRDKSGALREQYRDPIPFVEPNPRPVATANDIVLKGRARRNEKIKGEIESLLWQNVGKPLARKGLEILGDRLVARIDNLYKSSAKQQVSTKAARVLASRERSLKADNVIPFPTEKTS